MHLALTAHLDGTSQASGAWQSLWTLQVWRNGSQLCCALESPENFETVSVSGLPGNPIIVTWESPEWVGQTGVTDPGEGGVTAPQKGFPSEGKAYGEGQCFRGNCEWWCVCAVAYVVCVIVACTCVCCGWYVLCVC